MALYVASVVCLMLAAEPGAVACACPGSAAKAYGLAPAQVWRDTTVFYRKYEWFALIGAPIDAAAIIAPFTLAFLVRDRKRRSRWLPPARPA